MTHLTTSAMPGIRCRGGPRRGVSLATLSASGNSTFVLEGLACRLGRGAAPSGARLGQLTTKDASDRIGVRHSSYLPKQGKRPEWPTGGHL
jgi:hypothetical protein